MIDIAVKLYDAGDDDIKSSLRDYFINYRESNFAFSREYFFEKAMSRKIVLVYFIPESPSYRSIGKNTNLIAVIDEKLMEDYLRRFQNGAIRESYGLINAEMMLGNSPIFETSKFDTKDVYQVDFL